MNLTRTFQADDMSLVHYLLTALFEMFIISYSSQYLTASVRLFLTYFHTKFVD